MPPLAAYIRVSRVGDRADRLISPELQTQRISAYAAARDFEVEMLPPELDVSGGRMERPVLAEILAGIEAGRFAGIIVAQLDRLSRLSLVDAHKIIERIESAGGLVVAVAENFDASTPEGELGRNVMLSIARMERRRRGDTIAAAKERAVRVGIWPLPVVPIGYRRAISRSLEPNPNTTPIVVRAFELRAGGKPWSAIGELLGRGPSGARRVITNPVYLGQIRYGEWFNPAAHPPLVDVALFEAAQLDFPRPARRFPDRVPSLLAGVLRCAGCKGTLSPADTRKWRGYRCMANRSAGKCEAPAIIAASIVEPYVEAGVLDLLAGWRYTEREQTDRLGELERDLAAAEAELGAYQRGVQASGVGAEELGEGLRLRVEGVDQARRRLGEARGQSVPLEWGDVVAVWQGGSVEERRHVLRSAIGVVWVRKGRGPASGRVKISETIPPGLPRPGYGRTAVEPVRWDQIEVAVRPHVVEDGSG